MLNKTIDSNQWLFLLQDIKDKDNEIARLAAELAALGVAAKEGVEAAAKVQSLEKEVKTLTKENKTLSDNFNSERVRTIE